ncbi:MAG TPA: hypothetical protein ENN81_00020 [Phycisphaerales bacterium]|nr:hypothetical protein [Phycisphaerales bacterium]
MLSFQREADPVSRPKTSVPQTGAADQEYVSVKSKGDSVRRSTGVVVILFAAGLLGLWFMIRKSTPETASAEADVGEQTRVETAISQLTGLKSEVLGKMDTVLNRLYEFSNVQQVEAGELAKNPFEMEIFGAEAAEPLAVGDGSTDLLAMHRQRAARRAADLQLQSIIHGNADNAADFCMINTEVLKVGARIDEFVIRDITRTQVVLAWAPKDADIQHEEIQVVLKLAE